LNQQNDAHRKKAKSRPTTLLGGLGTLEELQSSSTAQFETLLQFVVSKG
jgi:hypothetical protein